MYERAITVHVVRVDHQQYRIWWMFDESRLLKSEPTESLALLRRCWERLHREQITELVRHDDVCTADEAERIRGGLVKRSR